MNADEAWAVIDAQRIAIADLLLTVSEPEWATPSLCSGWTVRDVVGHLTLQQLSPGMVASTVKAVVTARGDLAAGVAELARTAAVQPVGALINAIRSMAGRRHLGDGRVWPYALIDVLVHGQDIARPLGRSLSMPTEASREAATTAWKSPMFRARDRLAGFRLTADDTDLVLGDGERVSGTAGQLLLLITGRTVVVDELTGPGQPALAARYAAR